jgi:hypothetical protein
MRLPVRPARLQTSRMDVISEEFVGELEALAEARLGRRAEVVREILSGAPRSQDGLDEAISRIRVLGVPFVDPLAMSYLAEEMEALLAARAGRPANRYALAQGKIEALASTDQSWMTWSAVGCFPILAVAVVVAVVGGMVLWI